MSTIDSKQSVVTLLERLEKVACELRDLPDFVKQSISVNAACLKTEIDELEGECRLALTFVETELRERDEWVDLDLVNDDHLDIVLNALESLGKITERDQIRVIKAALESSDCFDSNLEGLNSMLEDIEKSWHVMSKAEVDAMVDKADELKTLLGNATGWQR